MGEGAWAAQSGTPTPLIASPVVFTPQVAGLVPDVDTSYITGDVGIGGDVVVLGLPSGDPMLRATALVFRWDGADWSYERELPPLEPDPGGWGDLVSVAPSGAVVGISGGQLAHRFRADGTSFVADPAIGVDGPTDLLSDVDVSDDRIVLGYYGSPFDEYDGKALVYRFDGATWLLEQEIVDARFNGSSGNDVALFGERMVVSARQEALVIYRFDGVSWVEEQAGIGGAQYVDLDGDRLLLSGASVWRRGEDGWTACSSFICNDQCDAAVPATSWR